MASMWASGVILSYTDIISMPIKIYNTVWEYYRKECKRLNK